MPEVYWDKEKQNKTTMVSVTISGGANKSNTRSNYESVTEQSGIYAGQEGFDVTVKGNTDLKGSVIDSSAPAEKNHLTTGTLTWNDIDNKADYKAEGKGIAYTKGDNAPLNAKGLTPTIAPTVKDEASSTTKSAVSAGTVTITDKENQKQDIKDMNRDTKNSLNKLGEIFDKTKVEERQELIGLLAQDANGMIHDLADAKGWQEGSENKVLLHTLVSGILGEMSGGGFTSGALAGGINEYVTGAITRIKGDKFVLEHPDMVEWVSTVLGGAVNKVAGQDTSIGAGVANWGTKWNKYQNIRLIKSQIEKIKEEGGYTYPDGKHIDYEKLKPGEYMVLEGYDLKDGKVGVAIDNQGNAYDVKINTNQKGFEVFHFSNGDELQQKEGHTFTIQGVENYGTDNEIKTGQDITYTVGEKDGNMYDEGFYDNHFSWADAGEDVATDMAGDKSNLFFEGLEQAGKGGKALSRFNQIGGMSLAFDAPDFYEDYYKYSGLRLVGAWSADAYPILFGIGGASVGASVGGWAGVPGGILGSFTGSQIKKYQKEKIPTDKEIDYKKSLKENKNENR